MTRAALITQGSWQLLGVMLPSSIVLELTQIANRLPR